MNGNVGIGTWKPAQILQIGSIGTQTVQFGNNALSQNGQIIFSDSGDNSLNILTKSEVE